MDFASWSPSHLILVAFAIVAFIGHVAIMFYRIGQNDKKIDKLGETFLHTLERLEERQDKRFVEINQQISGLRTETNQRLSDMQAETNTRLSDIEASLRQLNQNHIDHLTHHERT